MKTTVNKTQCPHCGAGSDPKELKGAVPGETITVFCPDCGVQYDAEISQMVTIRIVENKAQRCEMCPSKGPLTQVSGRWLCPDCADVARNSMDLFEPSAKGGV